MQTLSRIPNHCIIHPEFSKVQKPCVCRMSTLSTAIRLIIRKILAKTGDRGYHHWPILSIPITVLLWAQVSTHHNQRPANTIPMCNKLGWWRVVSLVAFVIVTNNWDFSILFDRVEVRDLDICWINEFNVTNATKETFILGKSFLEGYFITAFVLTLSKSHPNARISSRNRSQLYSSNAIHK